MKFWEWTFLGNEVKSWLIALGIAVATTAALLIVRDIIVKRFSKIARKTKNRLDDMIVTVAKKSRMPLLAILGLYAGTWALSLPDPRATVWVNTIAMIALLVQAGIWADTLIVFWLTRYQEAHLEVDAARVTTMRAASFIVRLVLFSIVALLALDNIPGVEVTALIASLGIGGIAIALAVQNILADLFASLTITLDKPFVIGDFIIIGDYMGSVEYIGLKTTRIRSLTGELIVFSNNDLLKSRIRNYKSQAERRVVFTFGVAYQTTPKRLAEIPATVREIIESKEKTRFDRAHFKAIGEWALEFEVVYFMEEPAYALYMDTRQAINLEIMSSFKKKGIAFAYPTRTLHIKEGDNHGKQAGKKPGGARA